jgi:threonylcarbamoyladenosine tRNA methylthiotransferase MtaB
MGAEVITFGCRLNTTESEVIRRHADAAGLDNTVVLNTCAVTAEAVRQARQSIRRLARERPDAKIIVTGCAAQTEPETFAAMPEVAIVLGNEQKISARFWSEQADLRKRAPFGLDTEEKIRVNDIMSVRETALHLVDGIEGHARAFVQVQNGCDHRCTFCIIPFGRGNSRSVPMGEVVAQVRKLSEHGYREVVLTGVDITSYGAHLPGAPRLGKLVRQILKHVPELERLRISSIDSVEADADLLDALGDEPRLMPHLHLSLQHGDDLILKRMKRRHTRGDAIAFTNQVRRLRPDIVFGGDIIAGFPTETDDMFSRSRDLVDECGLTHLHVFPYSERPGTPAARMPQVAYALRKERARVLREHGVAALRRHLVAQIGATRRVLTERGGIGRTEQFTAVRLAAPSDPGLMLDLTIANHNGKQLIAA